MIAESLEKSENSVRKLEEQCSHYYNAGDFFMLKQTIASIETFLLIFNPYTKFDLCRYWKQLEKKGYDPVVEYNKGLESFNMHFSPAPQEIFTIILQISRFLKEFSDFETEATPQFRHPNIRGKIIFRKKDDQGNIIMEEDSGIDPEEYSIARFLQISNSQNKNKGKKGGLNNNQQESMFSVETLPEAEEGEKKKKVVVDLPFKEDITDQYEDIKPQEKKQNDDKLNYLEDIGLEGEIKKMDMTAEKSVLSGHETQNVDIPSGKQKFLKYFIEWLRKKRERRKLTLEKDLPVLFSDSEEEDNEKNIE